MGVGGNGEGRDTLSPLYDNANLLIINRLQIGDVILCPFPVDFHNPT